MKTQLLNHWIVYVGNNPAIWSLSWTRKTCIEAFLKDSNLEWSADRKINNWTIHKIHIDILILS